MAAVRLDPWQNIVGVGWGGKIIGHLEVWMDLRTPAHGTDNPSAAPNRPAMPTCEARFLSPARDDFVASFSSTRGTDPNKSYPDWDFTCWQHDAEFPDGCIDETHDMPTQEIYDEAYMTNTGHFRIYPLGDTGGLTVNKTMGGATNFLINWAKVARPEFFDLPEGTPRIEWPALEIGLYGSVDASGPRSHTVLTRLRLLRAESLSQLNPKEPAWQEYDHDLPIVMESNRLSRSFSANYGGLAGFTDLEDAREHFATVRVEWGSTEEPAMTMEVVAP